MNQINELIAVGSDKKQKSDDDTCLCSYSGAALPLSALRLLIPPLRLLSAAIWQTVQQKVVADYGMVEEFVSTVTDIVPELLTRSQRAQLTLGLRAQVGLFLYVLHHIVVVVVVVVVFSFTCHPPAAAQLTQAYKTQSKLYK